MEIFEDASPYIYDKEQDAVVFRQDFEHLNPKAILADAEDWVDALRIARATTWTPETGPEAMEAVGYDEQEPIEDRIDFLFWAKS